MSLDPGLNKKERELITIIHLSLFPGWEYNMTNCHKLLLPCFLCHDGLYLQNMSQNSFVLSCFFRYFVPTVRKLMQMMYFQITSIFKKKIENTHSF